MSFYDEWTKKSEDISDMGKYQSYMKEYYELEQKAYEQILSAYPDNGKFTKGTVNELCSKLGFGKNLIFLQDLSRVSIQACNKLLI